MRKIECPREEELLEALQASRWPETCDPTLRDHVASCAACADLGSVAARLLDEHRLLVQEAGLPSSAVVWWRAQMRSRREAAEKAAQPISFVFGIAVACAAGLLATALGIFVPTFRKAPRWMADTIAGWSGGSLPAAAEALTSPIMLGALAAVLLCLLVAPVALYYTFRS